MNKNLEAYTKKKVVEYNKSDIDFKPFVSVIVITYNHESFIKECLDSILNQETSFPFEILVGDDDSNDGTREICMKYAVKYPSKIRLFLHSRENNIKIDGKPTGRFNYLYNFLSSKGKYIAVCEGDDFWIDNFKLQKQVDFLESHPEYQFCWTRFETMNQETNLRKLDLNSKYFMHNEKFIDFDFETFFKGWHIGNLTLVYRKDSFNCDIAFKFKYFRDVHLLAHLLKKGKGACLNFVSAVYRMHSGGIHSSIDKYNGYRIGYETHKEIYHDSPKNIFLKKRHILSFKNFINANIMEGYLWKALVLSLKLFFVNGSVIDLLKHFKRIAKALV